MKQIRIVTKVERTAIRNLDGMTRISETEVRLPSDITWEPLSIKPHAQLSIIDKQEDKNTVWDAKLIFKTCEDFSKRKRWAYRCLLSNGQYRLIGSNDRPYPVTSVSENMPENVTENQLSEVTVSWKSPRFIPVISE